MSRSANITAALACFLWSGLFFVGRDLAYLIYKQGPGIAPNAAQIDFLLVIPAGIASVVAGFAWLVNGLQRWFVALGIVSAAAVLALLPCLLVYGGGVEIR